MSNLPKFFVFILMFASLTCNATDVYQSYKTVANAFENKKVRLSCDIFGSIPDDMTVRWYYQPDKEKDTKTDPGYYIAGDQNDPPCGTDAAAGENAGNWCVDRNNKGLVLKKPHRSDNGVFTCIGTRPGYQKKLHSGYVITVHYKPDKPVIEVPWRILDGGEYLLKCKTEGYPEPNIDWYFENKKIESLKVYNPDYWKRLGIVENKNNGTLKIRGFTNKNVGVYMCQAKNTHGSAKSADTHLDTSFFTDAVIAGLSVGAFVVLLLFTYKYYKHCKKRKYHTGRNYDAEANYCKSEYNLGNSARTAGFPPHPSNRDDFQLTSNKFPKPTVVEGFTYGPSKQNELQLRSCENDKGTCSYHNDNESLYTGSKYSRRSHTPSQYSGSSHTALQYSGKMRTGSEYSERSRTPSQYSGVSCPGSQYSRNSYSYPHSNKYSCDYHSDNGSSYKYPHFNKTGFTYDSSKPNHLQLTVHDINKGTRKYHNDNVTTHTRSEYSGTSYSCPHSNRAVYKYPKPREVRILKSHEGNNIMKL